MSERPHMVPVNEILRSRVWATAKRAALDEWGGGPGVAHETTTQMLFALRAAVEELHQTYILTPRDWMGEDV